MSRHVEVRFEVRDMLIMKETLKQMGFNYNDLNEHLIEVTNPHIKINVDDGIMGLDSVHEETANGIKREYMVNFYKDKAIREGNKFRQEIKADGEVVIHITR